jgi:hypothetical protein
MKNFRLKTVTWYAIIGLLVAVALLPVLKLSPQYFPSVSGFADLDCQGVTCKEGQFCKNKTCMNVMPPSSGVPEGY